MRKRALNRKSRRPHDRGVKPNRATRQSRQHRSLPEPARPEPIIPLLDYQREDINSNARFRWNCWARQTGKSFTKSLRRILRGLARRRNQVFLSAGERQSRELMQKARMHCEALKIATEFNDSHFFRDLSIKQMEITLPGGVRIIGLPANPQTARGFTGDVFLDEFAMHVADREIWSAMFPTILRGEGELDVASTPTGKSNVFYQLRDNDRFTTSRVTLPDAIAQGLRVDEAEVRAAMGDEELYRQEFLCEFLDEATAFLTYDQIAGCVDPTLTLCDTPADLVREPGDLYVGVDVGRVRDLTVIWVVGLPISDCQLPISSCNRVARASDNLPVERSRSGCQDVVTTRAVFELANAPFREQFDLLCEVLANHRVRRCSIDAGGLGMQLAEQTVERFGVHRVSAITMTPAVKSSIATALRIAVEAGAIRIPNNDRIRNDWHSVERTVSETGHFRLSAPRREGSHADRFWAAALALHAADQQSGIAECLTTTPLNFARTGTW